MSRFVGFCAEPDCRSVWVKMLQNRRNRFEIVEIIPAEIAPKFSITWKHEVIYTPFPQSVDLCKF